MSDTNTNNLLEQALAYLEKGWSVIPVNPETKKPIILWKEYQAGRPTKEEITKWWTKHPNANIGLITGRISGIVVVDIDLYHGGVEDGFQDIQTVKVKTGGGGLHYYFQYQENLGCYTGIQQGIDIRANGGYVILPPSIHKSGNAYEWLLSPDTVQLASLPQIVKDWINKRTDNNENTKDQKSKKGNFDPTILEGVGEGKRNSAATSYIGKLLREFPINEWELVWSMVANWNKTNRPPLPDKELKTTFESIKQRELNRREEEKEETKTQALQLVEKIQKEQMLFFHNELQEGFAAIHGNGRRILKIRTRMFKQFLAHFFYKQSGKIVSSDVIANIIQVLEGRALFDGQTHELSARIVFKNNAVWYDLGKGSVIFIDKDGWTISETPPIIFRRYSSQTPQVTPQKNGDLKDLLTFVNLKNEEEQLLFLIFTVAAFIPGFPHPILVLYGPQGAGKTTPQRLLKSLIDPSPFKVLSAPDNVKEFVQLASHHYFFFFDNLSSLPEWLSNSLARAVTGDGFSKRELFSDDDDIIYSFQRTVALNGINLVVQRADLLERSILLGLERISKKNRRKEKDFWDEFDNKKPYLLGAIFDAVAGAIREYPQVSLSEYPRMADFIQWGCAIAKVLGYTQDQFLQAYYNNLAKQNTEAIEANPVAITVMDLMGIQNRWEGTATDLFTQLEKQAEALKINTKTKEWPKDPSALSRRLHIVQTNLAEESIFITRDETVRPKRIIIQKHQDNPDNSDTSSEGAYTEAQNDMSGFGIQQSIPNINGDNESGTQIDGMTGLSGLKEKEGETNP